MTKIELYESSIVNYLQGRNPQKLSEIKKEGLIDDEYFDIVIQKLIKKNILERTRTSSNEDYIMIVVGSLNT